MTVKSGDRMFVIMLRPGPSWQAGRPVTEQDLAAHRTYFEALDAQGFVVLAGPFLDPDAGGMIVLRGGGVDEATRIMNDDPAIASGVFEAVLRPFYVMFAGADAEGD